ncbi:MAG TPA: hypothetical protein VFX06_06470 [Stellaceae bacterium]|nr:hypothetical protein [Stellaceae bacterium]
MPHKVFIGAVGLLLAGMMALPAPAQAQHNRRQQQIQRAHRLCSQGYRPACIRFGYLLGENQGRRAEWRRDHPDWYWWQRW